MLNQTMTCMVPIGLLTTKVFLCKFSKRGNCKEGDTCSLAHSVEEQQAARYQMSQMSKADIQLMKTKAREKKARAQEVRTKAAEEAEHPKVAKMEELIETNDEAELAAGRDDWAAIDIKELVNKCARGEGVSRESSWADMQDDNSDGESEACEALNKAAPSSVIRNLARHQRKRHGRRSEAAGSLEAALPSLIPSGWLHRRDANDSTDDEA